MTRVVGAGELADDDGAGRVGRGIAPGRGIGIDVAGIVQRCAVAAGGGDGADRRRVTVVPDIGRRADVAVVADERHVVAVRGRAGRGGAGIAIARRTRADVRPVGVAHAGGEGAVGDHAGRVGDAAVADFGVGGNKAVVVGVGVEVGRDAQAGGRGVIEAVAIDLRVGADVAAIGRRGAANAAADFDAGRIGVAVISIGVGENEIVAARNETGIAVLRIRAAAGGGGIAIVVAFRDGADAGIAAHRRRSAVSAIDLRADRIGIAVVRKRITGDTAAAGNIQTGVSIANDRSAGRERRAVVGSGVGQDQAVVARQARILARRLHLHAGRAGGVRADRRDIDAAAVGDDIGIVIAIGIDAGGDRHHAVGEPAGIRLHAAGVVNIGGTDIAIGVDAGGDAVVAKGRGADVAGVAGLHVVEGRDVRARGRAVLAIGDGGDVAGVVQAGRAIERLGHGADGVAADIGADRGGDFRAVGDGEVGDAEQGAGVNAEGLAFLGFGIHAAALHVDGRAIDAEGHDTRGHGIGAVGRGRLDLAADVLGHAGHAASGVTVDADDHLVVDIGRGRRHRAGVDDGDVVQIAVGVDAVAVDRRDDAGLVDVDAFGRIDADRIGRVGDDDRVRIQVDVAVERIQVDAGNAGARQDRRRRIAADDDGQVVDGRTHVLRREARREDAVAFEQVRRDVGAGAGHRGRGAEHGKSEDRAADRAGRRVELHPGGTEAVEARRGLAAHTNILSRNAEGPGEVFPQGSRPDRKG